MGDKKKLKMQRWPLVKDEEEKNRKKMKCRSSIV